jgi:hypothetical protein
VTQLSPVAALFAQELRPRFPGAAQAEQAMLERAREDINAFVEYAFTDSLTGASIVQAAHHRAFQQACDDSLRTVVWFPVEHGKTTQSIMRLVHLLGRHPARQYAYIASKARQSEKVVAAVGREILMNARVARVFPRLCPERASHSRAYEKWGDAAIRVAGAPPGTKDASLAAYGIDGQILGSRLHGVIIDNVLDRQNTASASMRATVLDIIDSEVISRVLPGGFVWIIDTAWHRDDALHLIAKRPGWTSLRFDADVGLDGDDTLWPLRFPRKRLDSIRSTIPQTSYDRQYRNISLSDSVGMFKDEFLSLAWGRKAWCETLDEAFPEASGEERTKQMQDVAICTGVDLATRKGEEHDLTVLTTAMRVGHRYRLLNIRAGRFDGAGIIREMLEVYRRFHAQAGFAHFLVEDNAAQVYIVQMSKDAGVMSALGATPDALNRMFVKGRTTTAKKRDLELGVPSLAGDFEMGRWDIPLHHETDCLRDDMRGWSPDAHTGDRLMSLWLARDGIRVAPDLAVDLI